MLRSVGGAVLGFVARKAVVSAGIVVATRSLAGPDSDRRRPGSLRSGKASGVLALAVAVLACADPPPDAPRQPGDAADGGGRAQALSDTSLTAAAERIIAFLRGQAGFDPALFGDTVILQVAPEGGGARRRVAREALGHRSGWTVGRHRLVPPDAAGELTTRVGSHFNCMEIPLSTRAEELAALPHVGTVLRPRDAESCLQSWNMTLVFDSAAPRPALTAVLYDQWEW